MPRRHGLRCLVAAAAVAAAFDGQLERLRLSHKRTALFWAPPQAAAPVPLVVVLHGYNVDAKATLDFYFTDIKRLAAERGVAVLAPRGRPDGARGNDRALCWAAGACCCRNSKDDQDVAFVDEAIRAAEARVAVSGVVLVGHSNGGQLAFRVACARTDVAGMAVFNAPRTFACAAPPTRLYLRHGASDAMLGGRAAARVGHPHLPAIGVRATAETAAEANGCTGSVDTNATQAAHAWDALAPTALVARRAYTGCAADVVFDVVDDLGHWPAFGVLQTDLRGPLLFAIYGEPLVLPADDDAHDACRAAIPPKWGS